MNVASEVLNILNDCRVEGCNLFLPAVQLDRKSYEAVNKVLDCMGGKWNRSVKAHVFTFDPSEILDSVIMTGEVTDEKKEYQFYPTPIELVEKLVHLAEIDLDMRVLEPSAGDGAIAGYLSTLRRVDVDVCELNPKMRYGLQEDGYNIVGSDFLTYNPGAIYDRVIANPPFTRQQDIDHITHMIEVTKPGGKVVSIASKGVTFSQTKKAVAFREMVEKYGRICDLPEGSFKSAGTMVNAVIVEIDKPE
jgi:type I restriction-modification system DNA methylase subunit